MPPDARGWQLWVLPTSNGHPYRRLQSLSDVVPRVTNLAWMPDSRHLVLSLRSIGTWNRICGWQISSVTERAADPWIRQRVLPGRLLPMARSSRFWQANPIMTSLRCLPRRAAPVCNGEKRVGPSLVVGAEPNCLRH